MTNELQKVIQEAEKANIAENAEMMRDVGEQYFEALRGKELANHILKSVVEDASSKGISKIQLEAYAKFKNLRELQIDIFKECIK